jgi:uncharacterized protein YbdZ (MbtH family)
VFEPPVDAFWLHPFGDLDEFVETGTQSSLWPVYAPSTAGNRINALAASNPSGLQYLQQLAANPDVKWDKVAQCSLVKQFCAYCPRRKMSLM